MNKIVLYCVAGLAITLAGCRSSGSSPGNWDTSSDTGTVGITAQAGLSDNSGAGGEVAKTTSVTGLGGIAAGGRSGATTDNAGGKGGMAAGGKTASADASVKSDASTSKPDASVDACDRKCLIKFISGYLDALVAKDPSRLKVSSTVKFTINGVVAKLGDGLWKTASKLESDKRLDFADPLWGNIATQTVVDENGTTPVIYQVRLKVVKQEITEIESMEVRQGDAANGFFDVANMKPQPVFLQTIEPAKRMKRDQLKAVMELYMDYLEGKKNGADLPFDTNCTRYENGVATASGQAAFVMQSMWAFQVTRRYLVFDEEAGIAWGMFPFYQTDDALVVGEAFKIIEGKFMMIQAVMAYMPTKTWD